MINWEYKILNEYKVQTKRSAYLKHVMKLPISYTTNYLKTVLILLLYILTRLTVLDTIQDQNPCTRQRLPGYFASPYCLQPCSTLPECPHC